MAELFFTGEWEREFSVHEDAHSVYFGVKGDGAIDVRDDQIRELIAVLQGLLDKRTGADV